MYKVQYSKLALKKLQKLDRSISSAIVSWIDKNLDNCENPRLKGRTLKGNLAPFWRYRIGDYRILVEIKDQVLVIIIITIGHRKEVYN